MQTKKCKECIHFEACRTYVEPEESFPEVEEGCTAFEKKPDEAFLQTVRILGIEYEIAKRQSYVRKPLAFALHKVWRATDKTEKARK